MPDHLFETANQHVDRSLIESLAPGGRWEGDDYQTYSPFRTQGHIHSFHVKLWPDSGQWRFHDFADGDDGDVIEMARRVWGLSLVDAAKRIAGESTYAPIPEPNRGRGRPPAAKPVTLPTDAAMGNAAAGIKAVYSKSRILEIAKMMHNPIAQAGQIAGVWWYKTADGLVDGLDVRFEKDVEGGSKPGREKIVITYWYDGTTVRTSPAPVLIFGRDQLAARPTAPVVIHEGAKCAALATTDLPDFVHIAWSGGAQKAGKADWGCLAGREVVFYPDSDAPGLAAARAVSERVRGLAKSFHIRAPLAQAVAKYGAGSDIVEALKMCDDWEGAK